MTEQEALDAANPEWALIRSLYAMLDRSQRTIEFLTEASSADKFAAAFDRGFSACAHQHMEQRRNPKHPITRVNPYKEQA